MRFLLVTLLLLTMATQVVADDELIIIHSISKSGKTFAVAKGFRDKIARGQKSLFSTKKYSIVAQAIEVGQEYSMWRVSENSAYIPFAKGDYVNYNRSTTGIWTKLAELKDIYKTRRQKRRETVELPAYSLMLKGSYAQAISENVSITGENANNSRQGYQGEVTLYKSLGNKIELGIGIRADQDSYTLEAPRTSINSKRYFGMFDLVYHFKKFKPNYSNIYIGIGAGYGVSETEISSQVTSGSAYVFPNIKIGYLHPLGESFKLVFEGALESLVTEEKFATGEKQKTTIIGSKASVGLRF